FVSGNEFRGACKRKAVPLWSLGRVDNLSARPRRKSAVADLRNMMPISGKPEIGRGDPVFAKQHAPFAVALDSRFRGNERKILPFLEPSAAKPRLLIERG